MMKLKKKKLIINKTSNQKYNIKYNLDFNKIGTILKIED